MVNLKLAAVLFFVVCALYVPVTYAAVPSVKGEMSSAAISKAIQDIPVMEGLEVVEDNSVLELFGEQRIAQTLLRGRVDIDEVYYFYEKALPERGWRRMNVHTYQREGERLFFRPSSANRDGMTYIRFDMEPVRAE